MKFKDILARGYFIFIGIILFLFLAQESFSLSLDELYREIVQEENEGKLPEYFSRELREEKSKRLEDKISPTGDNFIEVLEKEGEFTKQEAIKEQRLWIETILAVKRGSPTAFDISRIERRAEKLDPEAVELLAWLYATGTGVKKDLSKALSLYNVASSLGVARAKANADSLYKTLSGFSKKKD